MSNLVSEEKEKKAQKKLVKGTGTPAEEREEEREVVRKEKRKKARPLPS